MILDYDTADAFRALGRLWAKEQAEDDDEGAAQIEQLATSLRAYKQREADEAESNDEACLPIDACCY